MPVGGNCSRDPGLAAQSAPARPSAPRVTVLMARFGSQKVVLPRKPAPCAALDVLLGCNCGAGPCDGSVCLDGTLFFSIRN